MAVSPRVQEMLDTVVTLDGVKHTVQEWIDLRGLKVATVDRRRRGAYSWAEALTVVKPGANWSNHTRRAIEIKKAKQQIALNKQRKEKEKC